MHGSNHGHSLAAASNSLTYLRCWLPPATIYISGSGRYRPLAVVHEMQLSVRGQAKVATQEEG